MITDALKAGDYVVNKSGEVFQIIGRTKVVELRDKIQYSIPAIILQNNLTMDIFTIHEVQFGLMYNLFDDISVEFVTDPLKAMNIFYQCISEAEKLKFVKEHSQDHKHQADLKSTVNFFVKSYENMYSPNVPFHPMTIDLLSMFAYNMIICVELSSSIKSKKLEGK